MNLNRFGSLKTTPLTTRIDPRLICFRSDAVSNSKTKRKEVSTIFRLSFSKIKRSDKLSGCWRTHRSHSGVTWDRTSTSSCRSKVFLVWSDRLASLFTVCSLCVRSIGRSSTTSEGRWSRSGTYTSSNADEELSWWSKYGWAISPQVSLWPDRFQMLILRPLSQ